MEEVYDYIVIGGGIAGLYFAMRNKGKTLVLEKNKRMGGRLHNVVFGDKKVKIPLGAGIGVASEDNLLIQLMNDLKINYTTFYVNLNSDRCQDILRKLYENINKIVNGMNFEEFMNLVLTKDEIDVFKHDNGHTDFYKADAKITMLNYGLIENCSKYIALGIDWNLLIKNLSKECNYLTSCNVLSIEGKYPNFILKTTLGNFYSKNIVIATTISSVKNLINNPIYDRVVAHPFMRIYASFTKNNEKIMKTHFPKSTIVHNKLHFIIPMRENVWMIAYTDGEDSISLRKDIGNNKETQKKVIGEILSEMCKEKVRIKDIRVAFWKEGVHYYLPGKDDIDFDKLRNPKKGIYVIGEMVADSQGWCGGALEVVDKLIN